MTTLTESVLVAAPLAETWEFYFRERTWPAWVDGFRTVESSAGYPEAGGSLVWRSGPAGRGEVRERVIEHSPRTLHRIEFADPESSGELTSRFSVEGEGRTRVELSFSYELRGGGPFAAVTDRLFVRSQVRKALQRTLDRLRHEIEDVV